MSRCVDLYRLLARRPGFHAAAASNFLHVPLSLDFDSNVTDELIVETGHVKENSGAIAYWLAIVVRKHGYFVELRWLGDETDSTFMRNLPVYEGPAANKTDVRVFPVGWAQTNNKPFEPPKEVREPLEGWRAFLEEVLQSKKVLTAKFHDVCRKENESCFEKGMIAEATDISKVSAMRNVVVEGDVGRRIKLRYLSDSNDREVCWFHDLSGEFLPCGWARIHGRELISTPDFDAASMRKVGAEASLFDFRPFLIPEFVHEALKGYRFEIGSKLELIHPLDRRFIRVGTVTKVMRNQLLLIEVDGSGDEVCFHAFSPNLLPAGFAAENGLMAHFRPPSENFSYKNINTVPRRIFQKSIPIHSFKWNQFLEAVRVPGTNLVHIARIVRVVGHLVLVHFEGYSSSEDQFFPISSVDLYPVGWCDFVGHELQIPQRN